MAHGTGHYWEVQDKGTFHKNGYYVCTRRHYNYYFEPMSDSYQPDREVYPEFLIQVALDKDVRKGFCTVYFPDDISTGTIGIDEANKIIWNIKNRDISYEQIVDYFTNVKDRNEVK